MPSKEQTMLTDNPSILRGARSYAEVNSAFIELLEAGVAESRTHIEQMSIDMGKLLMSAFPSLANYASRVNQPQFLGRMRSAAAVLWESFGDDAIEIAGQSSSDTVRGWAAFVVGHKPLLHVSERLDLIRPFACDSHFAVREWAWLSIRPAVATNTLDAIKELESWVLGSAPYIRRFATEVTRPRGVWSSHLKVLKDEPWLARHLLDVVASDSSRYVQNSVGNWLNDASKSRPDWVQSVCGDWELLDPKGTAHVRRRGMRTLARIQSRNLRSYGIRILDC